VVSASALEKLSGTTEVLIQPYYIMLKGKRYQERAINYSSGNNTE